MPEQSFRLVFSSSKEDVLGRHDGPVRCVEYSYAAGTSVPIELLLNLCYGFMFFSTSLQGTCAA